MADYGPKAPYILMHTAYTHSPPRICDTCEAEARVDLVVVQERLIILVDVACVHLACMLQGGISAVHTMRCVMPQPL
jgi:hypothetical protein